MRRRQKLLPLILLTAAVLALPACASKAEPFTAAPPSGPPSSPAPSQREPTVKNADDLIRAVRERKSLGVIVSLSVETGAGAGKIAAAQDRLLQELEQYNVKVTRRFKMIPAIAMVVDEPAMRALVASPHVDRIAEDQPRKPHGNG